MREQGGENEVVAPTTWGADWDYFDTANHVVIPSTQLHAISLGYQL